MYNYNHLFYFYITAKSGGVTNASKHLRLSQPSLSSQLKVLEQTLDMKLFNKVGRKNELTESGETVYGFCRKMFEFADEMNELVSKRMPSISRHLQIGISEEVDRSFVIEVVSLFLKQQNFKRMPKVTLISGPREQLTDRLRFKELDLLVSELAVIDPEINKIAYAEIPVVLTCSSQMDMSYLGNDESASVAHASSKNVTQAIARNKKIPWVMPSNKLKLKSEIDNFLEFDDISSQVTLETDSITSLIRAVKDGIGFSFLPLQYISQELHENSVQVIGEESGNWKYRVWLLSQQHNKSDELIKLFSKSFNEICRS